MTRQAYKQAVQAFNLYSMNEEATEDNIQQYGLCDECMTLIHETTEYYIVIYNEGRCGDFLNIIYKNHNELSQVIDL